MKWFKGLQKANVCIEDDGDMIIEKTTVYYIPCDKIRSNAMRSRSDFNEDKLVSLAYSIKKYGIIEPLCVRHTDFDDSYDYEIITGERRLRAARLLEMSTVPCIIVDVPSEVSAEMSLSENIFHVPLDYFEEAFALKRLCDIYGDSCDDLAARLSMSNNELVRKLRLLELDFAERQMILECNLSEDNADEISRIADKSIRLSLVKTIESDNMSNFDAAKYISCAKATEKEKETFKPSRDVLSAISGIRKRVDFINRHKKRAEMNVENKFGEIEIKIKIRN